MTHGFKLNCEIKVQIILILIKINPKTKFKTVFGYLGNIKERQN